MDRKLRRIRRWIERLAAACGSEAWRDALMEAECLEAEVRSAREDLWERVRAEAAGGVRRSWVSPLRGLGLAMASVLVMALPLATEIERRLPLFSEDPGRFEWVAPDEAHLLDALRRSLSEGNAAVTVTVEAGATIKRRFPSGAEAAAPEGKGGGYAAREPSGPPAASPVRTAEPPVRTEDLMTLLQAGERAMRGTRAVTIEQP